MSLVTDSIILLHSDREFALSGLISIFFEGFINFIFYHKHERNEKE
jgi:hypothetical protein